MMDSRSIDFAKTASIDMMTLNNKVVNMRQVVKRTKVHVVSKLCKHITALKKKKGTDDQKAKNLRKAQRFIEEIDSIKKLKEDKVSKYALANTTQFSDISKMSLSPGPRALARLADHPLMKKVVTDFREQHSDWRDLAAYLLIKQTGRRFKTKKQKQKKLARCVENINASETMTKAYIQERFGQEGLTKAEERFERKRKRPKSASKFNIDNVSEDSKKQETASENKVTEDLVERQQEQEEKIPTIDVDLLKDKEMTFLGQEKENREVHKKEVENVVEHNLTGREKSKHEVSHDGSEESETEVVEGKQSNNFKKNRILPEHDDSGDSSNSENTDNENTENDVLDNENTETSDVLDNENTEIDVLDNDTDTVSDKQTSNSDKNVETDKSKSKQRNECVVKELRLGETDDDSEDSTDDSDEATSSKNEDDMSEDFENNSEDDKIENDGKGSHKGRNLQNKKKNQVPEFLTKGNKTPVSDPFFAGSDDDDDDGGEQDLGDDMVHELQNSHVSDDDSSKANSMFYNLGSRSNFTDSSKWSQRGRGRRGGFERRGASGRFDRGQRGGTFRGDGRGPGQRYFGAGRGGDFSGLDRMLPVRQSYDKHDSKISYNDTDKQATKVRFGGKKVAELETNRQTGKGYANNKTSQEKLHPSWEASKKRKAEQSGLVAFTGSKITFDDDN